METASDSEIVYSMVEYFGILARKYRKPIVSVILYPFRASLPKTLVEIVQERFPPLTELAQQATGEVKEPQQLRHLVKQVSIVPDENSARWLLRAFAA